VSLYPDKNNCNALREGNMPVINFQKKLETFSQHWAPRIVSQFNGHDVMLAKLKGEFVWHSHSDTDDFFLVIKGNLTIQLRDPEVREDGDVQEVHLGPGELYIVPRGVEHRPVAADEVHVLLIETIGTPNTGNEATAAVKEAI
jgi:mannose-6-phosphate isomerase-like protein (cupin superfamily)